MNHYYLCERKRNLDAPIGKRLAVNELVKEILALKKGQELRVLDVGCGEGHILKHISRKLDNKIDFWGIDKDNEVLLSAANILKEHPTNQSFRYIHREIKDGNWTKDLPKFDVVYCVNVIHEIYSSLIRCNHREAIFKSIIDSLMRLVDKNGLLLIMDGLECENAFNTKITFEISNDNISKLLMFKNEYTALDVNFLIKDNVIETNLRDFTRFITKLKFIGSNTWDIERTESYQYFSRTEFEKCFEDGGFQIIDTHSFIINIKHWKNAVKILTPSLTFPMECIYYIGLKHK